ncbi:MAG TPA: hypothetical protein VNW29_03020 [Candidatus Sulfotelmatobacter sp.]|jgi:hypothetical protein|nr:hypothetical protein [Candidatus Sulfotelmatobacter sp.]
MNNLQSLFSFIDVAEKNRKYPITTANNLRGALRKIEAELNDEEKASLDKLLENINQIFHTLYQKDPTSMTVSSIETYKSRIKKVIAEYKKYGMNTTNMNSWNPTIAIRKKIEKKDSENVLDKKDQPIDEESDQSTTNNTTRFELPLRENVKAVILLPGDVTKSEVGKIEAYITFLKTIAKDDK